LIKKYIEIFEKTGKWMIGKLIELGAIIIVAIISMFVFVSNPFVFPAIIRGAIGGTITSVVTAVCFLNMGLTYDWVIPISIGFFILSFVFLYLEKEENQEPNH